MNDASGRGRGGRRRRARHTVSDIVKSDSNASGYEEKVVVVVGGEKGIEGQPLFIPLRLWALGQSASGESGDDDDVVKKGRRRYVVCLVHRRRS